MAIVGLLLHSSVFAQILNYDTHIKIEKGKKITERHLRILIADQESSYLAKAELPHQTTDQLTILSATIQNLQGKTLRKLKKKDIVTKSNISSISFYEDNVVETFELHWNEYPYIIEYTYQTIEKDFIAVAYWLPFVHRNASVKHASLTVELPKDYDIKMKYDSVFQVNEQPTDKGTIWRWQIKDLKVPDVEAFTTHLYESIPSVRIVPRDIHFGVDGQSDSWTSFGDWQIALNEGTNELTEAEKKKVDQLLADVIDEREKIRILYHYLQDHTKYINVSIDVGGLKSYPASYVCENKYGDCKALTTYMKALLQYANIPAYYTLVNAGVTAISVDPTFPTSQFNHVILSIPMEEDTIWLENTSNISPFNYLGTFTQDRLALMVKEGESQLVRTPKLTTDEVLNEYVYHFELDENGDGQVQMDWTLRNRAFESYNYYQSNLKTEEQRDRVEQLIDVQHFTLEDWAIHQSSRDCPFIKVSSEGSCTEQFREAGSLKAIELVSLNLPELEKPADRQRPLYFSYPIHTFDSVQYNLPFIENYYVDIPETVELESPYGSFSLRCSRSDEQTILIEQRFLLHAGRYDLTAYEAVYDFLKSIEQKRKRFVVVLKKK